VEKIKSKELAEFRTAALKSQGGRCGICKLPCSLQQAVVDHDHGTGEIRSVAHRGCNSLLGKLENNAARFGVVSRLSEFLHGAARYLMSPPGTGLIYPTHKTSEEKRTARLQRAKLLRKKKDGG
jgi:hypothetical protein